MNDWRQYLCVSIELTDFCNSRCLFCDHRRGNFIHGRSAQFMEISLLEKILRDLEDLEVPPAVISLSWLGESIIHPQFLDILKLINKSKLENFHLNTNSIAFTKEMIDLIMANGKIRRLRFSLDAVTTPTYQKIKQLPQVTLENIISNIRYFLDKRGNQLYPQAVFSFVVCEENRHEALPFLLFWRKELSSRGRFYYVTHDFYIPQEDFGVDVIDFYMLLAPAQEKATLLYREVIEEIGVYKYQDKHDKKVNQSFIVEKRFEDETHVDFSCRRPCASLWRMANIHSSGLLTICCHDLYLEEAVGNLKEHSFKELWYGERIEKKRKEHLEGIFTGLCEHCGNIEYFSVADEMILDYLERNNYSQTKEIYFRRMGIRGPQDFEKGHN